MHGTYIKIYI